MIAHALRQALIAWATDLGTELGLTITAHPPEPGAKPPLPTLACWWTREEVDIGARRTVGTVVIDDVAHAIDQWGYASASVDFWFRVGSEADAQKVRDSWRHRALYAAIAARAGAQNITTIPLTVTVAGHTFTAKLTLRGTTRFGTPAETQVEGLWAVVHEAVLDYPDVSVDPLPSGVLVISVAIFGTTYHLSSGADPLQATPDY